jgi:hypothetical protein
MARPNGHRPFMGDPIHVQIKNVLSNLPLLVFIFALSACASLTSERLVYDQQGIRVGIQVDPAVYRSSPPALNSHPAQFSPDEVRVILGTLHVSGWSGTIVGIISPPRPIPLFKEEEILAVAGLLAMALRQAGSDERVFFSLPNKEAPYSKDRTEGALFVRSPYLHMVVTDHAAFTRADTGGGEDYKDPRDNKGMKLWVAPPAQAASVPADEMPRWAPYETVHISLNTNEVSALMKTAAPARADRMLVLPQAVLPAQLSPQTSPATAPTAAEDQRSQIRELTRSNLDLRDRLDEQSKQMKELQEELARLQQELEKTKSKSRPPRKSPTP